MVADKDEYQVVVSVGLHVGDEAAQGVFNRGSVSGTYPRRIPGQNSLWRIACRGHRVEDRAVTDLAPVDESWNGLPRRMARDESDFCHHGLAVPRRALGAFEP